LEWPPNSPDLNPIENIWSYMGNKLNDYEIEAKDVEELWERLQDIWGSLPINVIHELYESMPQRI